MKLIDKDALVAEIERRRKSNAKDRYFGRLVEDNYFLSFIDTIEVKDMKELDLEKEVDDWYNTKASKEFENVLYSDIENCAKHFFELGLSVNNPITASDRGMAEEIIVNLKRVEQDYRINLAREMEWLRNKIKKGE